MAALIRAGAPLGELHAPVDQRRERAHHGQRRAGEQDRPERRVVVLSRRAERLPVAVDLEQGLQDGEQREADGGERGDRAAAPGHHQQRDESGERKCEQPAAALTEERGPAQDPGAAEQEAPDRRGYLATPGQDRAGQQPGHPQGDVRVGVSDGLGEPALLEELDPLVRARHANQLDEGDCRDRQAVAAEEDRPGAAAQRPERAQREHDRVQQRAVPGVPGELLLARPEHRQQAEAPVGGQQQHRRERKARGARARQDREADEQDGRQQQGGGHPGDLAKAALVAGEPDEHPEGGGARNDTGASLQQLGDSGPGRGLGGRAHLRSPWPNAVILTPSSVTSRVRHESWRKNPLGICRVDRNAVAGSKACDSDGREAGCRAR